MSFGRRNWTVLILFGLIGQIAWAVENMYFNLFVYETIAKDLDTVTLMVQLSGITATVVTLIAGTLSDRAGKRKGFICYGYIVWGVTVALFGLLSPSTVSAIFSTTTTKAITIALVLVVVGDCVMTAFGSTANDASFNAWVTDNTTDAIRGRVEGVLSILPLVAMLIVAGGFGIIVGAVGYTAMFIALGVVITACGVSGLFIIKDSPTLTKNGKFGDIIYGFKPSVIKGNKAFYVTLLIVGVYGIACQIFMPYLIIYMKTFLSFSVMEYSVVFGLAIVLGSIINLFLGKLSDKRDKVKLLYIAVGLLSIGLLGMCFAHFNSKVATLAVFGLFGFVMITGYIFVLALSNAIVRDYTPVDNAGKMQGVRMIFSVLIPMVIGPMIGNAINKASGNILVDAGADVMTTSYVPSPWIFLAASVTALLVIAIIPLLQKVAKKEKKVQTNETEN